VCGDIRQVFGVTGGARIGPAVTGEVDIEG
jgi:hypothetical protein